MGPHVTQRSKRFLAVFTGVRLHAVVKPHVRLKGCCLGKSLIALFALKCLDLGVRNIMLLEVAVRRERL